MKQNLHELHNEPTLFILVGPNGGIAPEVAVAELLLYVEAVGRACGVWAKDKGGLDAVDSAKKQQKKIQKINH